MEALAGAGPIGPADLEASSRVEPREERGTDGGHRRKRQAHEEPAHSGLASAALGRRCSRRLRQRQRGHPASAITEIGDGEGALNLVIWAGYAERGESDDPETTTGSRRSRRRPAASVNTHRHDRLEQRRLADAVGRVRRHLGVRRRDDPADRQRPGVAPIDTSVCRTTPTCSTASRTCRTTPSTACNYGVPHGRGPNLLGYNTDVVTTRRPAGTRSGRAAADYDGKISIYDSSIFIADAALHLMTTQPDLGIKNPYQLTQEQFDAAIELLEEQAANDPLYWGTFADQVSCVHAPATSSIGTTWQYQVNLPQADDERRRSRPSCPTRARPAGRTPG